MEDKTNPDNFDDGITKVAPPGQFKAIEKENKLIELPAMIEELVHRNLAKVSVTTFCDPMYYMIFTTKLLIKSNKEAVKNLKSLYGEENFKKKLILMNELEKRLVRTKTYYDGVNPKSVLTLNIEDKRFLRFQESLGYNYLIDYEVFELFFDVISMFSVIDKKIVSSAISGEYQVYKTFEINEQEQKAREEDRIKREGIERSGGYEN